MKQEQGKRWFIGGRVQGVGYRNFVERAARELGLKGFTRNLDDGRVEVFAMGLAEKLDALEVRLRKGPVWADVRHVESMEAALLKLDDFQIRS